SQAPYAIRKIDRTVGLHDDVIRPIKPLPLVSIGENRSCAIFLQTIYGSIRHCCDDQPLLWIQSQAIRADQQDCDSARHRLRADTRVVSTCETAFLEKHGKRAIRRPLINNVGSVIAKEEITVTTVGYPHGSFGQRKMVAERLERSIGGDDLVELGIELLDPEWNSTLRLRRQHSDGHHQ